MKPTADNYFSDTAEEFDSGYKYSRAFKERFKVWTDLWPKYLPPTGKAVDLEAEEESSVSRWLPKAFRLRVSMERPI